MKTRLQMFLALSTTLLVAASLIACADRTAVDAPDGEIQWPGEGNFENTAALALFIENDPVWKALKARFRAEIDDLAESPAGAGKYFDVRRWLPGWKWLPAWGCHLQR